MAQPLHDQEGPDPLCDYDEAARLLGVRSVRTVARYATAGHIARVKIGGGRRIVRQSIIDYKQRLAREAERDRVRLAPSKRK